MKSLRSYYKWLIVAAVLGYGSISSLLFATTATALSFNFFGRADDIAYFSGNTISQYDGVMRYTSPVAPYEGIVDNLPLHQYDMTEAQFFAAYEIRLNSPADYDAARAAATINMMLGQDGATFGGDWNNGVSYAKTHLAYWEGLVDTYYKNGWVNFNDAFSTTDPTVRDWIGARPDDNSVSLPDVVPIPLGEIFDTDPAVIFYNPTNPTVPIFTILKKCGNLTGDIQPLIVPATPTASCSGYNVNPATIEPTSRYTITSNVDFKNNADATTAMAGSNYYIRVTGPRDSAGNEGPVVYEDTAVANAPPATLSISPSGMVTGGAVNLPPTAAAGIYDLHWGLTGSVNIDCPGSFPIGNLPYFSVRGGDVSAGVIRDTPAACSTTAGAGIAGWNYDNAASVGHSGYYGAGSQAAAYAIGNIKSFASGQNPLGNTTLLASRSVNGSLLTPVSGAPSPHSYSFANTNGAPVDDVGQYGGGFVSIACPADYTANVPTGSAAWTDDYTKSGSYVLASGAVISNTSGNSTLGIDPATGAGVVINIKVNGDVYIASNIYYNDTAGPGKYPRLNIIATGNIYVSGSVTQLHGMFAAQNGVFATCAYNTSGTFTETTAYNSCNQSLRVYGAVLAKRVDLNRSYGTLTDVSGPSESFVYGPELWMGTPNCLANPTDPLCPSAAAPAYKSFVSLPPVL